MLCPICSQEMEKGTATFLSTTGFAPAVLNFTKEADKDKSIFAKEDVTKTVIPGVESESYYCEKCKIVMPVIK